ncbi:3-phosphoshikimate 1-carboxyvinyltransferase [Coprococcus sp. OM04-5BH]|uniref:3-phosphoshikimate 1-carboxyvinyltransferase n=1 Tax=Coprococcus sp. OM04-5BH TaxID=2293093 RepID=UPI000E535A9D|nr:3-phosphoshikimate 1-carboxyvinyltransferase [Coprococcus sp. OM04-5BH]RHV30981.1 3-phosphoshikimate 1-carboxyvinyltransferase [Coprococcus sp. OM04-5BH]
MIFKKTKHLKGEITVPGDKSISHRSIMLGSIASGITEVHGFLNGADCISSMNCFRQMGVDIDYDGSIVTIHGNGLHGLKAPADTLDVGNSGTTTRLMSGILAAQNFSSRVIGDDSICRRPMKRIITPLAMMRADITSERGNDCAPLIINGRKLKGIHYDSPVASAQVKSCVLLAGLYADGETSVTEPYVSRNHTELMLNAFGGSCTTLGTTATVTSDPVLTGQKIVVPGDISSAAYFLVAGLIAENSEITIKNVGINPTRDGIIDVIKMMGGDITFTNVNADSGEPTADITVKTSSLKGCVIEGDIIPKLIDEIPVIAILACFAEGETVIKDAAELKVKESNRIDVMVNNLSAMGADITGTDDGMIIRGGKPLHSAVIHSKKDHRIAMSFAVAAMCAEGETEILDADCVNISYPDFYRDLENLQK